MLQTSAGCFRRCKTEKLLEIKEISLENEVFSGPRDCLRFSVTHSFGLSETGKAMFNRRERCKRYFEIDTWQSIKKVLYYAPT
jgi:hypothetical protein